MYGKNSDLGLDGTEYPPGKQKAAGRIEYYLHSSRERTERSVHRMEETMTQDQERKEQEKKLLSVVVSVYNEEQALPLSVTKMHDVIDRMVADGIASAERHMLLCNDSS